MRISDCSSDVCSSDLKFDWLVGGFYANEKLRVRDNLRFGEDYGRFASCRIISGGGLNFLYSPTNPLCVAPGVGPATIAGASGASGPDILEIGRASCRERVCQYV